MKGRKKFIVIGTVVLAIGILATMCIATGGSGFVCGERWAHAGPFMHGCSGKFGGHFMKAMVLAHVDDMAETLELNEAQNEAFKEIREQLENNIDLARERRQAFLESVKGEINAGRPDMTALVGMLKGKISEMPAHFSDNLDLFLEFYNILDDSRKAQLIEMFRDRFEKCES